MFLTFFTQLREAAVPVSLKEYLTLLEALDEGLAAYSAAVPAIKAKGMEPGASGVPTTPDVSRARRQASSGRRGWSPGRW